MHYPICNWKLYKLLHKHKHKHTTIRIQNYFSHTYASVNALKLIHIHTQPHFVFPGSNPAAALAKFFCFYCLKLNNSGKKRNVALRGQTLV